MSKVIKVKRYADATAAEKELFNFLLVSDKVLIVSHDDLDGKLSAFLMEKAVKEHYAVMDTVVIRDIIPTVEKTNEMILSVGDEFLDNSTVIVLDRAADETTRKLIRSKGGHLVVIDHHTDDQVENCFSFRKTGNSAARQVYELIGIDCELSAYNDLVWYADIADLFKKDVCSPSEFEIARSLAEFSRVDDFNMNVYFNNLDLYINDSGEYMEKLNEECDIYIKEILDKSELETQYILLDGGNAILTTHVDLGRLTLAAQKMFKNDEALGAIFWLNTKTRAVNIRSNSPNFNIREWIKENGLKGGGHPGAGGFTLDPDVMLGDLVRKTVKL